jgi:hypothetical protein
MTNTNLPVIGYFAWWTVQGVKIKRSDLQQILNDVGIDYELPFPPFRTPFLKAVREAQKTQKREGLLIRKIKKSAEEYVFGLVDERVHEISKTLSYDHQATMTFDPARGTLRCDGRHRAFDHIQDLYAEYREILDSDDIREIILMVLRQGHAIGVRQKGGIYFVPASQEVTLNKVDKLVSRLPGGMSLDDLTVLTNGDGNPSSYIAIAPLIDAERSKKAIYKAFVAGLKDQMGKFEQELAAGFKKKSALKNRLKAFKELRTQIEFYRDALQFQVSDLTKNLDELTGKVKQELFG